ncbi:SURF1 family protein [Sphingomonas sp. RHCKR7]|uniref:SURF1 family protein n=1 Tax=Sphingomonas folli TaxID=2862497 RepID=UPI001CA5B48E|nr:SURF1 family cytochrome oxidase biogenesis protein [Sphingomonas folli]MBW6526257.1 SURF1 family protein [Sphingomonas folli]
MTRRHAFLALAVLGTALLAGLGVWQLERRAWKLALIDRVERRLAAPPVAAPPRATWRRIDDRSAYLRVRASGRWRAAAPVFVQAVTDLGGGYWVIAPLDTPGGTILVNRGFVPLGDRAAIRAPTGGTIVTGLLRVTEPEGAFLRDNDPAADRWYSRDTAAIARARRLGAVAPYFIDADAGAAAGWPRGGMTVVRFRNTHLIYALTWFALAAMMAYLAYRIARTPRAA